MKRLMTMVAVLAAGLSVCAEDRGGTAPVFVWEAMPAIEWTFVGNAKIVGDELVCVADREHPDAYAVGRCDLVRYDGKPMQMHVTASSEGVAKAAEPHLGFQFVVSYLDVQLGGNRVYPGGERLTGDEAPREILFRDINPKTRGETEVRLGLMGTSGKAVFNLKTLQARATSSAVPRVNAGYKVRYPDRIRNLPRKRGFMLGGMGGDAWQTLSDWGVTLVRHQMTCRGTGKAQNHETYLKGYYANFDKCLDELEATLKEARKRGILVCIDQHSPPGGGCDAGDPAEWRGDCRMFHDPVYAQLFIDCWVKLVKRMTPYRDAIYGYDLINEAYHNSPALPDGDIVSLQRRCAEAIRAVDPDTPVILESMFCDPGWFAQMSAIKMDNVIYQVHLYYPHDYTHQGVYRKDEVLHWPDPKKGWNRDFLVKALKPVIDFQKEHDAKMFVGEFSAIAWAPEAADYIADCISIFEELGWDWTYHAFREYQGWSVEHEAVGRGLPGAQWKPSKTNPRMETVKRGLRGEIGPKSAAIPLPEHPRPDWNRADWINLNGEWEFGFKAGVYDQKILVPFGWGSPKSGVKDGGENGYYRRRVTIPADWKGKRVFVIVGASDHDTTCRFDGDTLGSYSGGYVPFEFELTESVRWGEAQTLEFDVWDPSPEKAMNGHWLYGKQGYGNARGIWQTVYLEARGTDYLENVRLTPSLASSSVKVVARFGAPARAEGSVDVTCAGQTVRLPVAVGACEAVGEFRLDSPRLWTLDDPHLYDVTLTYGGDAVKTYFGFREIGTGRTPNGDNYLTLNGKPVYLQLCLDQSYHPEGFYTFPSDEVMKNEMLISKQLGLSGNRVHIKVEVPRKLYWADRLGLLIQADVPCAWGDASEKMFEESRKCFEAMVTRDYNHPSIYQWTLFNETWGLFSNRSLAMGLASGAGGKKRAYRADTQRRVANAYYRAKAFDPTRIIEDNSPCGLDHVVTDVNSWHAYRPGYDWENTVAALCEQTSAGSTWNYIGGHVQGGEPMMNSECGNVWGYRGSTGDCDFTWDYHLMMNAFRRHLKCGGWLYTEHHDVINEWNGYVRYDRTWKETGLEELADMTLADFHRDAALFFAGKKGWETGEIVTPGQQVTIPVGVSLITDRYAGRTLGLTVAAWHFDGAGRKVETPAKSFGAVCTAKSWQCEKLWDVPFVAPTSAAAGCVVLTLTADGAPVAKNFWSFSTVDPKAAASRLPSLSAQWSGGTTNVLGGLKLNGFGKGYFEFDLPVGPSEGGSVFRAELSAKRKNGKDQNVVLENGGLDFMLGGGTSNRSKNPNSYPQTSVEKHPANIKVYLGGTLAHEQVLPDDPADHRGILSWFAQLRNETLQEAGSYGYLVEVPVPASAVKNGRVKVRIESDGGLAVYGPAFGRYPLAPTLR